MTRLPLALAAAACLPLSACVVDAGSNWSEETTLMERTSLAREPCGEGKVASVNEDGFQCVGGEETLTD